MSPLVLAAGAARANPLDTFGLGARASAMGSAYAAVADDSAAGYYNPAGLARSANLRIDLGYQAALPKVRMADRVVSIEPTRGLTAGLLVPGQLLGLRFAFGVTLFLPDQHVTRIRILRLEQPRLHMYDNRTQRFYMAANLALRLLCGLYVGAGLTFMSHTQGTVQLRGTVALGDPDRSALQTAVDVDLLALRYPQAGITWEVNRWLTLAAVYRHRFLLEVDQGFEIHGDVGDPGRPPVVKGATLIERTRSSDLFQPWQVVLGGALRLPFFPRLLLSLDLTFARWSEQPPPAALVDLTLDIGKLNDYVHLPKASPLDGPGFHDLLIPALGAEWRALEGLLGGRLALDLRAGYRYEASTVPAQPDESSLGDADRHIFSLGAGVTLERVLSVLPRPISVDAFFAATYLPERRFLKQDPRSPVGDFTVGGAVFQAGGQVRWQL